jgi:putative membrane protein
MHFMDWFGGGWSMMGLWWVLIIVAAVVLGKWMMDQRTTSSKLESPMEVLKRRYASGEISKEEFEEKKRAIVG